MAFDTRAVARSDRAKAYSRAADSLAALAIPLPVLIEEGRLTEIPASEMRSRTSLPNCTGPGAIRAW